MDINSTQVLITDAVTDFGLSIIAILASVLTLALAYLVFRIGWNKTKSALNSGDSFDRGTYRDYNDYIAFKRGKSLNSNLWN